MTCLVADLPMTFAGTSAPSCFAAVKNIGTISPNVAAKLSAVLCERLARGLGVSPERTYIEFTEATGALWGWNGETFG